LLALETISFILLDNLIGGEVEGREELTGAAHSALK
jgi:hypothetical protein